MTPTRIEQRQTPNLLQHWSQEEYGVNDHVNQPKAPRENRLPIFNPPANTFSVNLVAATGGG